MILFDHPDEPSDRPPTPKQMDLLRRIVATNGGGLSTFGISPFLIQALVSRHLIQGKAGHQQRMVHTPRGLALSRAAPAGQSTGG